MSTELLVLSGPEVDTLLDRDALRLALADGFRRLSDGQVRAPTRTGVDTGAGAIYAMTAWMPGAPYGMKLVSVFDGNDELGLPSHQAMISLFDPVTGTPTAVLDGTVITALRTAAAAALSVELLARPEARTLAIIGAGVQGAAHLEAVPRVRDVTDIRIVSRSEGGAATLAATHERARAVGSVQQAVTGADIVCLCTGSASPVLDAAWIEPGTHVTSVGFAPPGSELPLELLARVGCLAVEGRAAFTPPPGGCVELAGIDPGRGTELGELVAGRAPGRHDANEITLYTSMGHAMEDLVAAGLVVDAARRVGLGQRILL